MVYGDPSFIKVNYFYFEEKNSFVLQIKVVRRDVGLWERSPESVSDVVGRGGVTCFAEIRIRGSDESRHPYSRKEQVLVVEWSRTPSVGNHVSQVLR